MKNFVFMAIILLLSLGACRKEKEEISPVMDEVSSSSNVSDSSSVNTGNPKAIMTESNVTPTFGKPNVTNYFFKVYDPSGTLALAVKLYEKATGTTTYFPMTRTGSYWTLSKTISTNGWYDWRYVYNSTHANISTTAYTLSNSKNTFNSCPYAITWPFGADGSTFYYRNGWIGAMEGGCGSGWNQNGHHYYSCGADDSYAEDWNKNCSTSYADDGAAFRSPLDGKVVRVFFDSPSNHNGGYGNAIDIEQTTSSGNTYVFRIAHLKYAPTLSVGQYIRAGVTTIGYIGMSGGTSTAPHAHCALYNSTTGCNIKTQFLFSAN